MGMIDDRGRLFGKLNLIDAAALVLLLGLLPLGYAAYLLFRPATPRIESVTQVPPTREELRLAAGATIGAKLKVRGSGFNPLLRAMVGETPALSFVFENPNSADVVISELPLGTYDLVLYDGVQEVARAVGAVKIQSQNAVRVRAVGRLSGVDAATIKPGFRSAEASRAAFEVAVIGHAQPAVRHVPLGRDAIDVPVPGAVEYPAVLLISCDPGYSPCVIGGVSLTAEPPIPVQLAGGHIFAIDELLPPHPPSPARIDIQFSGPHVGVMKAGDRDDLLDDRAAVVQSLSGNRATLQAGADRSRDGWDYRGRPLRVGAPFRLQTDRYEIEGTIISVAVTEQQ